MSSDISSGGSSMVGMSQDRARWRGALRRSALHAALAAAFAAPGVASAFEIESGNPDVAVRWDNTVRYNFGARVQSQDEALLKNVNIDDANRNFANGALVTNRFDILSELDVVFKRSFGFRVSAAGWLDTAYSGNLDNQSTATANTLVNGLPVAGALSPPSRRYSEGVSGEVLDAFVFANLEVNGMSLNAKAGQHTVYWGDSLLLGGVIHGVTYSQNSVDVQKGFATPGTEAKELFRPRGGITLQLQPVPELSLAAQWFYNWQAVRMPESGNYLEISDAFLKGGDSFVVAPNPFAAVVPGAPAFLRAWRSQDIQPSSTSGSLGDWGVSARWSPAWLDGTLGLYARNTTDILPQAMLTPGFAALPAATCTAIGGIVVAPGACIINPNVTNVADLTTKGKLGTYNVAYGTDIRIYGVTLAKNLAGVSIGAEVSYRENMPLNSDPVQVLPAALVPLTPGSIATTAVPTEGTPGARGNTYHGLINALGVLPRTPLFDTASYAAEFTWNQWSKVTNNEAVFQGRDTGPINPATGKPAWTAYTAINRVSKNFYGLAINFTPTWFQVFPGVDILAPLTWSQGLSGNASVLTGGNEGAGSFSVGISADLYAKYRVDLKYTGYFGNYTTSATGAATTNGLYANLSDRGWVSLTFKTTF